VNAFALIAILLPVLGSAVGFAAGRYRRVVQAAATAPTALACLAAFAAANIHGTGGASTAAIDLAPAGSFTIWFGTRVTGLSATIGILVVLVALAVQAYSVSYMRHEPRYPTYAALISLFTGAMLLVVYSADLIVLLAGWEIMGICSYFLIGHHWERRAARAGSLKAFLVTKTGDVPFLFGIIALGVEAGSFRIDRVLAAAASGDLTHTTAVAALLLCGVLGKSAQFPLHTWLPDAMAGPTPISALIHAATMVAAGIYFVALLYPVFVAAPAVLTAMAAIAAVTMLGGALAALAHTDIKKILAYSTVSQLAYMLGGLASGARTASVLQLLAHGAFKALLFLAAGVIIHRVGSNELSAMGGLRHRTPVTFWTMTFALGALAGVPPLSGFFAKDAILGGAWSASGEFAAPGHIVVVAGLVTALLTAAYATRLWLRVFFGPVPPDLPSPVIEAPTGQLVPLLALAVPTVVLGVVALWGGSFATWIGGFYGQPVAPGAATSIAPSPATALLGLLALVLGFGLVWAVWRADPRADPAVRLLGPLRIAAREGFYLDDVQSRLVVAPVRSLAKVVAFLDTEVVDAYVRGSGVGVRAVGGLVRRAQTGNVQLYLTALLTGVIVIACVFAGQVG
jgi:NADH-quinone oxidoreductase subunit L